MLLQSSILDYHATILIYPYPTTLRYYSNLTRQAKTKKMRDALQDVDSEGLALKP